MSISRNRRRKAARTNVPPKVMQRYLTKKSEYEIMSLSDLKALIKEGQKLSTTDRMALYNVVQMKEKEDEVVVKE